MRSKLLILVYFGIFVTFLIYTSRKIHERSSVTLKNPISNQVPQSRHSPTTTTGVREMDAKLLPYMAKLSKILEVNPLWPKLTKVLNHLYIGSEADATNMRRLRDKGITHVVNCAEGYVQTGPDYYTRNGDKILYLGFKAEDDVNYNIMQHFDDVYSFIENARKTGGKVLVHCIMGVNRSGAMTVAYTMVHKDVGPLTAAKLVKDRRRGMLLTNAGFQAQLIKFASDRGYLDKDQSKISRM